MSRESDASDEEQDHEQTAVRCLGRDNDDGNGDDDDDDYDCDDDDDE